VIDPKAKPLVTVTTRCGALIAVGSELHGGAVRFAYPGYEDACCARRFHFPVSETHSGT